MNGDQAVSPGNAILMTGFAGEAGTEIIFEQKREELLGRFTPGFLAFERSGSRDSFGESIRILENCPGVSGITKLGEGGFYQGLWDFMRENGCGVFADLQKVPIRQETVEAAEFFGGNPYRLFSEGCVIAAAENPEEALNCLAEAGIPAAVIGEVRKAPEKTVLRDGESFYLERVKRDFLRELGL